MPALSSGIVETQKAEIKKLETTIQEAESEKKNQKKELEGVPFCWCELSPSTPEPRGHVVKQSICIPRKAAALSST